MKSLVQTEFKDCRICGRVDMDREQFKNHLKSKDHKYNLMV